MCFLSDETVCASHCREVGHGEVGGRVAVNVYHHVWRTASYILDLKPVGCPTDVLVLREHEVEVAVAHLPVARYSLYERHEDGASCLVVSSEDCAAVGGDDCLAHALGEVSALWRCRTEHQSAWQMQVAAVVATMNNGCDVSARRFRRDVKVRHEHDGRYAFGVGRYLHIHILALAARYGSRCSAEDGLQVSLHLACHLALSGIERESVHVRRIGSLTVYLGVSYETLRHSIYRLGVILSRLCCYCGRPCDERHCHQTCHLDVLNKLLHNIGFFVSYRIVLRFSVFIISHFPSMFRNITAFSEPASAALRIRL